MQLFAEEVLPRVFAALSRLGENEDDVLTNTNI
jgi:hypothetical protein